MKILVINCHPDNRGDEAAVHAMVDEIGAAYPGVEITLAIRGAGTKYPNMPSNVKMIHQFMPISSKAKVAHRIAVLTGGKVSISSNEKDLISEISKADIILHAPGGPSIGDTYYSDEPTYLAIYDLLIAMQLLQDQLQRQCLGARREILCIQIVFRQSVLQHLQRLDNWQ